MRRKRDCGQATVITVLFMTVLLAMTAAVLDVGSWFRADRALQATVDAAALAGAQELPKNPGQAKTMALQYAGKNGGGVSSGAVKFSSKFVDNDTIEVTGEKPAPGFFSKLLGIDSVKVGATAKARTAGITKAKYVAPIVVHEKHPGLQCDPNPCSGPQTLTYQHLKQNGSPNGAGNFGFINLTGESGNGTSEMGDWILHGYNDYLGIGDYDARTGNPFSSSHVKGSLEARLGDVLLFPIYRKLTGGGTGAKYEIIGWVGFRITGMDLKGNNEKLFGEFTEVIWEGIQTETGTGGPADFGVKAVQLVE
jgi:putative Flp pilus-assembly TadE/G-like protein